jgi:hypothetical protein
MCEHKPGVLSLVLALTGMMLFETHFTNKQTNKHSSSSSAPNKQTEDM